MATDNVRSIYENALEGVIEEMQRSGKSEAEIYSHLEKKDHTKNMVEILRTMSDDTFTYLKNTMFEEVLSFRGQESEFIARQEQKWGKCFVVSEALYMLVLETAEGYSDFIMEINEEEKQPYQYTYFAMKHIHGRALQQYLEVITLMKNGFADGAYSRWRSMYELSIIGSFIVEHGEDVAKAYIKASETEDRYDWAKTSGIFGYKKQRHVTFNDIQNKCTLNSNIWKKQYNLANKLIHASPQGTFSRISNMKEGNFIPVGRSDYGLTTPGEHSAITLSLISGLFFTVFSHGDTIVATGVINRCINLVREYYFKTHDEVFPEADKLWNDKLLDEGEAI